MEPNTKTFSLIFLGKNPLYRHPLSHGIRALTRNAHQGKLGRQRGPSHAEQQPQGPRGKGAQHGQGAVATSALLQACGARTRSSLRTWSKTLVSWDLASEHAPTSSGILQALPLDFWASRPRQAAAGSRVWRQRRPWEGAAVSSKAERVDDSEVKLRPGQLSQRHSCHRQLLLSTEASLAGAHSRGPGKDPHHTGPGSGQGKRAKEEGAGDQTQTPKSGLHDHTHTQQGAALPTRRLPRQLNRHDSPGVSGNEINRYHAQQSHENDRWTSTEHISSVLPPGHSAVLSAFAVTANVSTGEAPWSGPSLRRGGVCLAL
ncbi:uncharacterized protein LOC117284021 [Fukomys damarensis]|uniref:uncharacterized protein LOC117284021 n=1 Tax=Fukomys damarensis TaxID=885580 RepID=UPI001455B306|nr:uncharacterized protein LOC117284021 [Fukomys damarensis]